ncbi:hypothetical protein J6590_072414 [Homalodisca vitripennis]|nr:hypothetical protein J6590_072414 [Homalodisca vitripennis]
MIHYLLSGVDVLEKVASCQPDCDCRLDVQHCEGHQRHGSIPGWQSEMTALRSTQDVDNGDKLTPDEGVAKQENERILFHDLLSGVDVPKEVATRRLYFVTRPTTL